MMRKKVMAMLLSSVMAVSLLTGCGGEKTETEKDIKAEVETESDEANEVSTEGADNGDFVELSFYMMNSPVNDLERILEKANEIIGEKLNAKLNLIMVDSASYADKMNLMINSGDAWDLCFAANWGGINFFENAAKGAYADLTDLIPLHAPETYSRIPESLWEGVKVDGKIYGLVNYQQWGVAKRDGFKFRSDLAEEFDFDWESIKGMSSVDALNAIEPFLGQALEKYPEMIGWETSSVTSFFADQPLMWEMEAVGDMLSPGWVLLDEPTKVINQFATDDFKEYCSIMRNWYDKGYVRKDGATVKDITPDRKAGKIVAEFAQGWPDSVEFPGRADTGKMSMCTLDIAPAVVVSTTRTIIPAAAASTASVSINAQSPNIERAIQLVELLNTNDELYLLITEGAEGTDYVYEEDGSFTHLDGQYLFNWNEWQIGQSYSPDFTRALYEKNEAGDNEKRALSMIYEADQKAEISPLTGFTFDPSPVKTQIANCSSVISEMIPALSSGSVDPESALPEFLQRLETAGVDEIIAEKQSQLDTWNASK